MMFYLQLPHSFIGQLPEDDHNRRPKHVAGYAEYNNSTYLCKHLLAISHKRRCTVELHSRLFSKHERTQKVRSLLDSHADDPNNSFHILY